MQLHGLAQSQAPGIAAGQCDCDLQHQQTSGGSPTGQGLGCAKQGQGISAQCLLLFAVGLL